MPISEGGAEGKVSVHCHVQEYCRSQHYLLTFTFWRKAIYIDTDGTFRPQRITGIAERFGINPQIVLENIAYTRAHSSEHQNELLKMAAVSEILHRDDSIPSLFVSNQLL